MLTLILGKPPRNLSQWKINKEVVSDTARLVSVSERLESRMVGIEAKVSRIEDGMQKLEEVSFKVDRLTEDSEQQVMKINQVVGKINQHDDQGRIQDLIRGGAPDHDRPKLPTVCSSIVRAKRTLLSVGSGARLRAPEALGYFITKYAFSPFWGTFLYYF